MGSEGLLETLSMLRKFLEQRNELGEEEFFLGRSFLNSHLDIGSIEQGVVSLPKREMLDEFYESMKDCRKCRLASTRNNLVFGDGNPDAGIMFVGEAPGGDEDIQGLPFVGRAGKLLTRIIGAIDLKREDVYIANIIKCRPPRNRDPEPDEVAFCEPYLKKQIEIIQPTIICALGRIAGQTLLKTKMTMAKMRGGIFSYNGTKLLVTYHPAALLRNPQLKKLTWEDVKLLRNEYDGVEID